MSEYRIDLRGNERVVGLDIVNEPFMPEDAVAGAVYATYIVKSHQGKSLWESYLDQLDVFILNGRRMRKVGFDANTNKAHYQSSLIP